MTIQAHKSFFRVRGIFIGKNNPKFLREGQLDSGIEYQSINFGTKTCPEQIVYIEKFATKNRYAYAYSKSQKKSLEIPWDERNEPLPKGYSLIIPDWDLVDKTIDEFEDGDSIVVVGELDFQEYKENINVKQIMKNIYKSTTEIDFEAEGFEEEAIFNQEITINSSEYVKEEDKIYVNCFIFKNRGKNKPILVTPAVFTIYPSKDKKFASNMMKLKYGDTLKVDGLIHSRLEKVEVEENDGWGTKHSVGTKSKKEYEIVGAHPDTLKQKLYKEEEIQDAIAALQSEKTFSNDDAPFTDDDLPF